MTIRLALNQLEEEGLIQRYRAKGTLFASVLNATYGAR